ncbi:hypothetical protein C8J25_11312 [Sphingomonas faeni]|uniref:Lipoprotein n=1 Tax=Sphingomonas faeni TaxID=185950 RepID=A0A2T5TXJ9_9SPHN|nr:hypothetical protein [Sphingomonas faeni]PTW43949.1 hypothetical protein C8J25_11312 [Sphingomonas faeni]
MKKFLPFSAVLIVCGCQQEVAVPTAQELIANRPLLKEWQTKCDTGQYSHLTAEQKPRYCSTTEEANISVTEAAAAKSASDFYNANTRRK